MRAARRAGLAAALLLAACGGGAPSSPGLLALPLDGRPQRGPDDAWVTVVEFSDFQCPYCAAAEPLVRQLLVDHPADLRLVYRHFPLSFHLAAQPAAEAAECARLQGTGRDGLFWEMHDALMDAQPDLAAQQRDPGALLAIVATRAGVPDLPAWQACLSGGETRPRITADQAQGAPFLQGTPSFVVNGRLVYADTLRAQVSAALAAAQASGIPRAQYYDVAILGR